MTDGWERLARRIVTERAPRWRTRRDFAQATGLSVRLLDDLETGARSRYKPSTLAAVEVALGWLPGSCLRVVGGGSPRQVPDPLFTRLVAMWPLLSDDARLMLVNLAESSRR